MEHLRPTDRAAASSIRSNVTSLSSRDRKALILRCQAALFSAYRSDQYADPEGFKNSLGAVLEGFPDEVIMFVCDPRTGIQRRSKWPPTLNEIVEACEEHEKYLRKIKAARTARPALAKPYERPKPKSTNVFMAETHPSYPALAAQACWERYTAPDGRLGIMVPAEKLIELGIMKPNALP